MTGENRREEGLSSANDELSSRGSGQHSRTSSVAEPLDGFSNYGEIVQHLQSGPWELDDEEGLRDSLSLFICSLESSADK